MKIIFFGFFAAFVFAACNTKTNSGITTENVIVKDTLVYPYKAVYSSDVTSPSHPEIAQKVLSVWKYFEENKIDSMRSCFADSVVYDNAEGHRYHGSIDTLLSYIKKEMSGLDSMRFDLSRWESVHFNDKNEDWVSIWAMERHYPKKGNPDSILMQENWRVKDGKVIYFDQYTSKVRR